ncbi:hypothetical protein GALMADRAFT_256190 [Galerina marginata CBS 339.88]|uniref:DUF6533 domain-containing protein n=1 Tax=Galerina marginata (strain CBS 339.88) TaxID=685588 RepID=A0A067SEI4_GALM3|nr:hypothetical protein GALMADRAFT_256190 [Galerina marginata CBS 339.88]
MNEETAKWMVADRSFSFLALAAATCTIYDHLTTLDDEIELIWKRPRWSPVQYLFLVNRYAGDAMQFYSAFVFVRHIMGHTHQNGNPLNILLGYLVTVVLGSMQGIMVYRVSSMYSHKRKIIYFLAVSLVLEVTFVIFVQLYAYKFNTPVPDPAPGVHLCSQNSWPSFMYTVWIPIAIFEFVVLSLSLSLAIKYYQSVKDLPAIRPTAIPWHNSDSLLYILLRDSITFPFICLTICIVNFFIWMLLPYLAVQISFTVASFAPCIIGSRLIINLREAYYKPFIEECNVGVNVQHQLGTFEASGQQSQSQGARTFTGQGDIYLDGADTDDGHFQLRNVQINQYDKVIDISR